MTEIPEDVYTIVKFMDADASARVYRGEKLLHNLENAPLTGFELALESVEAKFRRLHLFANSWEDMADFAFAIEWKKRPLSELLAEVKERGIDVEVYREHPVSDVLDGAALAALKSL